MTGYNPCPTCGGKLTVLFTSVVCDHCSPPAKTMAREASDWQEGKHRTTFLVRKNKGDAWYTYSTKGTKYKVSSGYKLYRSPDEVRDHLKGRSSGYYIYRVSPAESVQGNFVNDKDDPDTPVTSRSVKVELVS